MHAKTTSLECLLESVVYVGCRGQVDCLHMKKFARVWNVCGI